MPKLISEKDFSHGTPNSVGILLVNLGTPDNTKTSSVRRYLRQFLSDPRVIEVPKVIWWFVLNLFILPFRPSKSAEAYKEIWTKEGSPLLLYSEEITKKIQKSFNGRELKNDFHVELAMSYGKPSIENSLNKLRKKNVRRILLLPMYPQYSSTTTGSVFENVTKVLSKQRWIPEFRHINQYHDNKAYIETISESIKEFWKSNGTSDRLLFSFHGLPKKMLLEGDPYHCQCYKTARLVSEKLELSEDDWFVSFQSRLGPTKWLEPYTDETLKSWGEKKSGVVDVICPGFSVDCLETLEEIAMENAEYYEEAGGKKLRYIPALNSQQKHISFLINLIEKNISDWIHESTEQWSQMTAEKLDMSRKLAQEKGAKK
ncbi:MAG: ferrochelatase [Woeseiaceae bacterium]|nr:ferrochelatase [Woeseiaceae bacterium]|tara:strand:- start:4402 stop:5517 length:1116 start_codon:yes stop_codon:yes gene_type:complete